MILLKYFLTASNVTDSSITQMNSLMLGFTGSNQFVTSDLSSLSFTIEFVFIFNLGFGRLVD